MDDKPAAPQGTVYMLVTVRGCLITSEKRVALGQKVMCDKHKVLEEVAACHPLTPTMTRRN